MSFLLSLSISSCQTMSQVLPKEDDMQDEAAWKRQNTRQNKIPLSLKSLRISGKNAHQQLQILMMNLCFLNVSLTFFLHMFEGCIAHFNHSFLHSFPLLHSLPDSEVRYSRISLYKLNSSNLYRNVCTKILWHLSQTETSAKPCRTEVIAFSQ